MNKLELKQFLFIIILITVQLTNFLQADLTTLLLHAF